MLRRVAENLYWMGRNLERSEFYVRFLKVQFYSTLDAPMSQNKDFALRSIVFMSGAPSSQEGALVENDVLHQVLFDPNNPNSTSQLVYLARENTRSIKNSISSELWQSINKWYLFVKSYSQRPFASVDIFNFTQLMTSHVAMIKSNLADTILHDDHWHFINMGIFMERTTQVLRILRSKMSDAAILSDNGANKALLFYQWTILLKSLEAFDVYRVSNRGKPMNSERIFTLILSNPLFPRSTRFTTNYFYKHLSGLSLTSPDFQEVQRNYMASMQLFESFKDFSNDDLVVEHIDDMYGWIANVHEQINQMCFR